MAKRNNKEQKVRKDTEQVEVFADQFELGEFDASNPKSVERAIRKWKEKQLYSPEDEMEKQWKEDSKIIEKKLYDDPIKEQMMGNPDDWAKGWTEVEDVEQ